MVHKYYSHTEYKNSPDATDASKAANAVGRIMMFIGSWMVIIALCAISSEGIRAVLFVILGAALVYLGLQCGIKGDERAAKIASEEYKEKMLKEYLKMKEQEKK